MSQPIKPLPYQTIRRPLPRRAFGFSLIELMVAVAIIGILAAIAVPNYRDYLIKGNRSAAQQFMLSISNVQEQYLLDNRAYASAIGAGGLGMTAPDDINGKYTIAISGGGATSPTSYTIIATAIGGQTADGNLTLDNTGAKTPVEKW